MLHTCQEWLCVFGGAQQGLFGQFDLSDV